MNDFKQHDFRPTVDANEMNICKACGRPSPPHRTSCLYCGKPIEISVCRLETAKLNLRKLESWESGYNLISSGLPVRIDAAELSKCAKLIGLGDDMFQEIINSGEALPVARLTTIQDAEIALKILAQSDFRGSIVSDKELDLKSQPKRLRKLTFDEDRLILTLFNNGESVAMQRDNLVLAVRGSVFEKRIETTEKYVKSKENKPLSVNETAKDTKIIDIYDDSGFPGYRILNHGFDFSSLGKEMSFLAVENMEKLFEQLKIICSNAKVVDSYDSVRKLIGEVWDVDEIAGSHGAEKKGVGTVNIRKETKTSNLAQFTRFSRLKRHLL